MNGDCVACPSKPAACDKPGDTTCGNNNQVFECRADPVTGCLVQAGAALRTCSGNRFCNNSAGDCACQMAPAACVNGAAKACADDREVTCANDNSPNQCLFVSSGPRDCQFGCRPDGSACRECEPGDVQCDGKIPSVCSNNGVWEPQQACPYVCLSGTGDNTGCQGVCSPNDVRCEGRQPQRCNNQGQWRNNGDACPYRCDENGSQTACGGSCRRPNTRDCDGNTPRQCAATPNGTVWTGVTIKSVETAAAKATVPPGTGGAATTTLTCKNATTTATGSKSRTATLSAYPPWSGVGAAACQLIGSATATAPRFAMPAVRGRTKAHATMIAKAAIAGATVHLRAATPDGATPTTAASGKPVTTSLGPPKKRVPTDVTMETASANATPATTGVMPGAGLRGRETCANNFWQNANCGSGQYCQNGNCQSCGNQCTLGDEYCSGGRRYRCETNSTTGCREYRDQASCNCTSPNTTQCGGGGVQTCGADFRWDTAPCPTGQECQGGTCVCDHECNVGGSRCQNGRYETCGSNAAGCRIWQDQGSCNCSSISQKRCNNDRVEECSTSYRWEIDEPCTEYAIVPAVPASNACACDQSCSTNGNYCSNGDVYQCDSDSAGCRQQVPVDQCNSNETCTGGECRCDHECDNDGCDGNRPYR